VAYSQDPCACGSICRFDDRMLASLRSLMFNHHFLRLSSIRSSNRQTEVDRDKVVSDVSRDFATQLRKHVPRISRCQEGKIWKSLDDGFKVESVKSRDRTLGWGSGVVC